MDFSGKFALRNTLGMEIWDRATGTLKYKTINIKTAPINQTDTMTYVTGGQGNSRFECYHSDKNMNIEIELAVFDKDLLAIQNGIGTDLSSSTTGVVRRDKDYTVGTADTVDITWTPSTSDTKMVVQLINSATKLPTTTFTKVTGTPATGEYAISGKTITFFTGDVPVGSIVRVYQSAEAEAGWELQAFGDIFAKNYQVYLTVEVRDLITDEIFVGQFDFKRASLSSENAITFSSDGDPAVQNATLSVLSDIITQEQYTFIVFDDADLTTD